MKCQSSKFIIISIFTFLFGIGSVRVWQNITVQNNVETQPQSIQNFDPEVKKQPIQIDFCEEIKKNQKYPNAKLNQVSHRVSFGISNQRVCSNLPLEKTDLDKQIEGRDYIGVWIEVDENGFVVNASARTKSKFANRFEKLAKGLRVRPFEYKGVYAKSFGILIFYPNENYSKR